MVTVDGLAFDAQVVGEYVYAESDDATFALQARHEATTVPGVGRPTSVTGIAVRTGGVVLEVFSYRAPGLGSVRVDGVDTVIGLGETLSVNAEVQITRQSDQLRRRVRHARDHRARRRHDHRVVGVRTSTRRTRSTECEPMSTVCSARRAAESPTTSCRRAPAVGYTVEQVYGHTPELYTLTDSWRLTDPADSMFTVAYGGFDDVNWPMNEAALAPYRAQVIDMLGSITKVCGSSTSGTQDYTVDALALELSIGTPLGDLGRFTCNYIVYAYNGAGPEQYPTPGVAVTFDAPGLTPCTGVSNNDGWASCRLAVALDELADAPDSVTISAIATWPETGEVLTTTTIPVAVKAPLSGSPGQFVTSLELPITLAGLSISGTLIDDPDDTEPWAIKVTGYDESGQITAVPVKFLSPDAAGRYDLDLTLPPNTVEAYLEVAWPRRAEVVHVTGLAPDTFVPATFDVDARDGHLTIDGQMLYGGAPAPDSATAPSVVSVIERGPDGLTLAHRSAIPVVDPVTGEYHLEFELSSLTRSVEISAEVATGSPGGRIRTEPTIVSGFGPAISQQVVYDAIVDEVTRLPIKLLGHKVTWRRLAYQRQQDRHHEESLRNQDQCWWKFQGNE